MRYSNTDPDPEVNDCMSGALAAGHNTVEGSGPGGLGREAVGVFWVRAYLAVRGGRPVF
jgi:hypothetical protein